MASTFNVYCSQYRGFCEKLMGIIVFLREFMPSLEEFFEEAIEQAEPSNMVEEEYKYVWTSFLKASNESLLFTLIIFWKDVCVVVQPFAWIGVHMFVLYVAELCETQITAGALCGCCLEGVHTFSNRPTNSSKIWQTI